MKKLLAIVLTVIMLITVLPINALIVFAADDYCVNPTTGDSSAEDTVYATMSEAITAAKSAGVKSIKLETNVILTEPLEFSTSSSFTLNLNGHSITYSPAPDGDYYYSPAIIYTSTNTSSSPSSLVISTLTTTEEETIERTDTDGTFVNNGSYPYFFKVTGSTQSRLSLISLTTMHGYHNWYGDLTVEGAYTGHSNGTDEFYGDIISDSLVSLGTGYYKVHGNIICSRYVEGTYSNMALYGYLRTLNLNDPYKTKVPDSKFLGKTTFKATDGNKTCEKYNGYNAWCETDSTFSFGDGSHNNTIAGDYYFAKNLEISISRSDVTAASSTTFSGNLYIGGDLTGSVYMLDSSGANANGYLKTAVFNNAVTIGGSINLDCTNYGAVNFKKGIISECDYTTDDGATSIPSDTVPITVENKTLKNIPSLRQQFTYEFSMLKGASIRLDMDAGIRFYSDVSPEKIAELKALGATVEMGTLISNNILLDGDELTFDLPEEKFSNVPFTSEKFYTEDDFTGIVGSIVRIKQSNSDYSANSGNLTLNYVGRGYVKVTKGDVTVINYANYYDDNVNFNTRSIRNISQMLQNDEDTYNTLLPETKSLIDTWSDAQRYALSEKITDTDDFDNNVPSVTLTTEKMLIGYNIGDYFDGRERYYASNTSGYIRPENIEDFVFYKETLWGNVPATEKYIKFLASSGVQAIRLPVTWSMMMEGESSWTDRQKWNMGRVDEAYLDRVQEVVNLILENDMYCIINVHHDGHMNSGTNFPVTFGDVDNSIIFIQNIWSQVGKRFKDYGSKLLFEPFNEVGDGSGSYTPDSTKLASVETVLEAFIKEIRSQGGNNAQRYLVCPSYCGITMWSSTPFADADTATDKLILTTHNYPSIDGIEGAVKGASNIQNNLNVGCIIDEIGGVPSNANNGAFATELRRCSDLYNVSCFWWDNGQAEFSLTNRYYAQPSGPAFGQYLGNTDIKAPTYTKEQITNGSIDSTQPYYIEFYSENSESKWAKKYLIVTSTNKVSNISKYTSRISQGYYSLIGLDSGYYTYYESDDGITYSLMVTRAANRYSNMMYYDYSVYGSVYSTEIIDTNYNVNFNSATKSMTQSSVDLLAEAEWINGEYGQDGIITTDTTNGAKRLSVSKKIAVTANQSLFLQASDVHSNYSSYFIVNLYDSEGAFIKTLTVKSEAFTVTADTASISITLRDSTETESEALREKIELGLLSPELYALARLEQQN